MKGRGATPTQVTNISTAEISVLDGPDRPAIVLTTILYYKAKPCRKKMRAGFRIENGVAPGFFKQS